MSTEIERKFRVDPAAAVGLGTGEAIRQGYLAGEGDVEVRMRINAERCVLTVKAGGGLRRTEVERSLTDEETDALWPHTAGRRLEKVRHRVDAGGHTAEVDVYGGALQGIVVAEVEFASTADAEAFTPPAWFGEELTGRREWSNAAMARRRPV
jgi:CYTH domain-containing protein